MLKRKLRTKRLYKTVSSNRRKRMLANHRTKLIRRHRTFMQSTLSFDLTDIQ